jgi:uncharacterized membrane protein (DUF485 family)
MKMKIKSKQYKNWNKWALSRIFVSIIAIPISFFLRNNLPIAILVFSIWFILFVIFSIKQNLAWNKLMISILEDKEEYLNVS